MHDPETKLDLLTLPSQFFATQIAEASKKLSLQIEWDLKDYLVRLMCQFVSQKTNQPDPLSTTLFELYKDALESDDPSVRKFHFKNLGDLSLYVSGYFQDSFRRKTYSIDYYIQMGRNAYQNLSDIDHQTPIYNKLSKEFPTLVDILAELAASTKKESDKDLLHIYDLWVHSRSDRLRKILEDEGIDPIGVDLKKAN